MIVNLVVFSVSGIAAVGVHPDGRDPAVPGRRLHDDAGARLSINLLTLLALVLAIGLVVDDAIIVVENVNRHLERGQGADSRQRSRQRASLARPIIAMTVVLIAVYVPIAFQGGLTGALFTEFAFTLVGAVTISAVVALTLSPMMCSRLLKPREHDRAAGRNGSAAFIDRAFDALRRSLPRRLHGSLDYLPVTIGLRSARAVQHLFPLYGRQERAGAAGGPGRRDRIVDPSAGRHAAAEAAVFAAGLSRS